MTIPAQQRQWRERLLRTSCGVLPSAPLFQTEWHFFKNPNYRIGIFQSTLFYQVYKSHQYDPFVKMRQYRKSGLLDEILYDEHLDNDSIFWAQKNIIYCLKTFAALLLIETNLWTIVKPLWAALSVLDCSGKIKQNYKKL